MQTLTLTPSTNTRPILDPPTSAPLPAPSAKAIKTESTDRTPTDSTSNIPTRPSPNEGSLYFIGTATTILTYANLRILTDPNFLRAGDHVHLGPGVQGTRRTNPAVDLEQLPPIDLILLSHYHADHFDQDVEGRLRRDLPVVTTPHAKRWLKLWGKEKGQTGPFREVTALGTWESVLVDVRRGDGGAEGAAGGMDGEDGLKAIKGTAMPGKHVPPGGVLEKPNDLAAALGQHQFNNPETFTSSYRIYVTGDTLLIDELHDIPKRYAHLGRPIDLMLIHLGGTTIPGPSMPLLMVMMDAEMGIELLKLVDPKKAIPVHFDDYDVSPSGLEEFKAKVGEAG